jgi:hypothetical protein
MRSRTWLCDVARGQHVADGGHEGFRRSLADPFLFRFGAQWDGEISRHALLSSRPA